MRVLLGIGILFAALPAAVRAQDDVSSPPGQRKVVRIRFEGNRRYTAEFLKEQIATKEGQVYDPGLIARDEQILRRFFAAVTDMVENDVKGGIEIVFHVLDKVVIGDVIVLGLARVKKKDFEDLMATRAGRPLLEHSLEADRKLIERLHRAKGYRFAQVSVYRRPTKKADVEDVVFQVIPAKRVKVREVVLEGARSLDESDLRKIIKNSDRYRKTYLGLGKLFNPTYYDRAAIDEDRRRMELYYEREGFLDAKVVYVDTTFDQKRKYATLKYRVEEGPRYRVGSFRYLLGADWRSLVTAPLIYSMIVPLAIVDLCFTVFQHICFRAYGMPRVLRRDYRVNDRQRLAYLNTIEKVNCFYCGYGNGVIAYAREIVSRTEQYWCPIRHANRVSDAHRRYPQFFAFGDAQGYQLGRQDKRQALREEHHDGQGS